MPRGAAPAVFTLVPLSLDPIKVKHGQPEGRPGGRTGEVVGGRAGGRAG